MIPRLNDLSPFDAEAVPTFVWIGRLDVPKQPDTFVRACAAAAEVRPLRGVVLGAGEMSADLRASVAALGAPVEFIGETDDVPRFLTRAWGLCLFSGFEGVPFAVQEAMWARRAVVVSPLPTIRWFAADAAIYAADVPSATQALLELCDPDTAVRAGALAGSRVREMLSPEDPFPKLLSVYQRDRR
jgi:glycosyltransferase involved in cell wall biosynthesis